MTILEGINLVYIVEEQRSETFLVTIKQAQISPLYILKEDIIQAGINPESICSDDF